MLDTVFLKLKLKKKEETSDVVKPLLFVEDKKSSSLTCYSCLNAEFIKVTLTTYPIHINVQLTFDHALTVH